MIAIVGGNLDIFNKYLLNVPYNLKIQIINVYYVFFLLKIGPAVIECNLQSILNTRKIKANKTD